LKQKILVRGPVFSVSGYGEQTRLALRSLKTREDLFDIYLMPINWGRTGWMSRLDEEREWFDALVHKTVGYVNSGGVFDISLQITIPNEWEQIAPINVGFTAGIETTLVDPEWINKSKIMDRIIVVSEHSKNVFLSTVYTMTNNKTGETQQHQCDTPIDVVNFAVRSIEGDKNFDLDLDYDFNFLTISQWGPRKNVENTIRWFLEENYDQEVGLVMKLSLANNSIPDRAVALDKISSLIKEFDRNIDEDSDRKCKIYLLHGDLTEEQMHQLYNHSKIKCLVTLTHGEGFGLPIFEAAYNGLPIIAPGWSGHLDYLYGQVKSGKKTKIKKLFESVDFNLDKIQKEAVWKGVLHEESMWCYPTEGSYKMKLRKARNKIEALQKNADILKKQITKDFSEEKIYKKFVDSILESISETQQNFDDGFQSVEVL